MSLRDLSQLKKENIRYATAPLKIDLVKEYFANKELFFVVDYAGSEIKGNMFLTYLTNLDLPYEIDLSKATKEEKFELVKIYMETRNISTTDVLRLTVADLMLTYIGLDTSQLFHNAPLNSEEKLEFINQNLELIKRWDQFLSSCFVYLLNCFPLLKKETQADTAFDVIDDPSFVGLNVVNMFGIPDFMDFYFSLPPREKMCYFKPQFEEYMFRGQNLYFYFQSETNTIMTLMSCMLENEELTKEFLKQAQSYASEFTPAP